MENKKEKRRPLSFLFVEEIKFWYFKYILSAIIISVLVAWLTINLALSHSTKLIKNLAVHAQQTSVSLSLDTIVEILRNTQMRIRNFLIIESIILIIIGIIASLYFVYRLVGAVKRINREVDNMLVGNTPYHRISTRKRDYLQPFVEIINKLIDALMKKQ
jgi:hypothetical protein